MREVYSKFIIEGENLIMAKCTFHKELATNTENVKGGGSFKYNGDGSFTFSGRSYDFGEAKLSDISKCVSDNKVFGNRRLTRRMSDHTFFYDNGTELIKLN